MAPPPALATTIRPALTTKLKRTTPSSQKHGPKKHALADLIFLIPEVGRQRHRNWDACPLSSDGVTGILGKTFEKRLCSFSLTNRSAKPSPRKAIWKSSLFNQGCWQTTTAFALGPDLPLALPCRPHLQSVVQCCSPHIFQLCCKTITRPDLYREKNAFLLTAPWAYHLLD